MRVPRPSAPSLHWAEWWAARRPDSEHEQATWRVIIGSAVALYLWSPFFAMQEPGSSAVPYIRYGITLFVVVSTGLLVNVLLRAGPSTLRRYIGMMLDLGTTSIFMATGGAGSIPLIAVYLWVTVGNGFRYGLSYLFASTALSLAGFGFAVMVNHYWSDHVTLAASTALILFLIPTYSAALIEKLNRAVQQARQASEAKSRFISNMSHELRTPLNGVIGSADLLGQTRLDPEQHELLSLLHGSAQSLLELIEEVLDISKIESGHLSIERAPFDLHQLFSDTARLFTVPAEAKGLRLNLLIDPNVPAQVIGDATHLRQVLTNLLSNAVKFTERGTITVTLDALEIGGAQTRLRCTVSDTGIGIAEENLAHIFERFRQADDGATRKYGGTGLGTAISRNLIELMGGHIDVESRLGQGSRFWFELPIQQDRQATAQALELDEVWILADSADATLLEKLVAPHVREVRHIINHLPPRQHDQRITLIADLALLAEHAPNAELPIIGLHANTSRALEYPPGLMSILPAYWAPQTLLSALHVAATPYARRHIAQNGVSGEDEAPGEPLKLLVAEDNAVNRRLLERILINAGHRVELVEDGEAALDCLDDALDTFDAIILDMNMPLRNGIDVAKALRFLHPDDHTPLIMLSADATKETIDESRRAGFDAYLTKPVEARRLLKLLQDLHLKKQPQETASSLARTRIEQAPPLVDHKVIKNLELLGSDRNFVVQLVQDYLEDGQPQLERMLKAGKALDAFGLRDAAHALRSSSAELGCQRLTTLCGQAERLKDYEIGSPQTSRLLEQIDRAFTLTRGELMQHTSGHAIASL
ncbi:MAG: ATP-binding protein [Acidihalobacter sp.]|uniref:ATP-binding protein n=1 Tax=Acidihalobacter sp. TaxID=1872108 RepID=UPI00307F9B37